MLLFTAVCSQLMLQVVVPLNCRKAAEEPGGSTLSCWRWLPATRSFNCYCSVSRRSSNL